MSRCNLTVALLSAAFALTNISTHAQTTEFEVAAIRPNEQNSQQLTTNVDLDASDYFRYHGGPVLANGLLVNYIIFAYKIENASLYPELNAQLPKWAQTQRFYVEAKVAAVQPSKDDIRGMMRALLADRFSLKVHADQKEHKAYALRLLNSNNKNPRQLRTHADAPICGTIADKAALPQGAPSSTPAPTCGTRVWNEPDGNMHLRVLDYSMPQIAGELSYVATRLGELNAGPLIDETNLPGHFDLDLIFARRSDSGDSANLEIHGPDFIGALATQAGLTLKQTTVFVDVLIVDEIRELLPN